jgi:ketosteroid isomerase-like protein
MTHPNATMVRELYDLGLSGNTAALVEHLCGDCVVHVPGHNAMSGDYQGPDGFLEFLGKNFELAGEALHLEIEGVLADDERGISFEHITAERDGKTLDVHDTTVYRFQDGKVAEMWMLSTDLDAHEAFWS